MRKGYNFDLFFQWRITGISRYIILQLFRSLFNVVFILIHIFLDWTGYSTHEVVIQHKVDCVTSFSCPTSCEVGYKCGLDGCPTCECLVGYVQPQTTCKSHVKVCKRLVQWIEEKKRQVIRIANWSIIHANYSQSKTINNQWYLFVILAECIDCEYIDFLTPTPEPVTYVPTVPKQTETVYVTGGSKCHDCDVTPQMVSYVKPRPQTQTVYVTNPNECYNCEPPVEPQMVSYVKPRPQTEAVYVTGKSDICLNSSICMHVTKMMNQSCATSVTFVMFLTSHQIPL